VTFGNPIIVRSDITSTDKPWIAVDNTTGTGQHDVYVSFSSFIPFQPQRVWLAASTDGGGAFWSTLQLIQQAESFGEVQSAIPVIGPNHVGYVFWIERTGAGVNWLRVRQVLNRGLTLGAVNNVRQLVSTVSPYGNLGLKRSNSAAADDTFSAFAMPVPAANPSFSKAGHLYVAYADQGSGGDKADVFFVRSTDGGVTWTSPVVMSTTTANDQWMPVLAVKPDGTKLFVAWYDRRNDVNNSLIDMYGRWGTIDGGGNVIFGTEFRISTASFPPVFAGTLAANKTNGHYDPVYPPELVNLHWWYPEWPEPDEFSDYLTQPTYKSHVGEYNGVWADESHVYLTWTDYRLQASGTVYPRNQGDIRFERFAWQ